MTANELYEKISKIDVDDIAVRAMNETRERLLIKNREQLLEGKRRDGQDITPSYYDDPYFDTRKQAEAYSNWKDSITPNPKRKKGTPNLYINGFFHRTIKLNVEGELLKFFGAFEQLEIERKYSELIFGLATEKKIEFIDESLYPNFIKKMQFATGLKVK